MSSLDDKRELRLLAPDLNSLTSLDKTNFIKLNTMKEVYYKGQPYQYKVVESGGKRLFHLYENGMLKHSVEQGELDIRSIVTFILDSYYQSTPSKLNRGVLH